MERDRRALRPLRSQAGAPRCMEACAPQWADPANARLTVELVAMANPRRRTVPPGSRKACGAEAELPLCQGHAGQAPGVCSRTVMPPPIRSYSGVAALSQMPALAGFRFTLWLSGEESW